MDIEKFILTTLKGVGYAVQGFGHVANAVAKSPEGMRSPLESINKTLKVPHGASGKKDNIASTSQDVPTSLKGAARHQVDAGKNASGASYIRPGENHKSSSDIRLISEMISHAGGEGRPVLIDSNIWMDERADSIIGRFFDLVVVPAKVRLVMSGEQFAEIDRRRSKPKSNDGDAHLVMERARNAIRLIDELVQKGLLKIAPIKSHDASYDFDSFAIDNLIEPTLSGGRGVILITNDRVFRSRAASLLPANKLSQLKIFDSSSLSKILGVI